MRFKSLNESILSVTNPQPKVSSSLVEEQKYIEEYIAMLEAALESIAEELECDVEDLLEDVQTPQRKAEGEKDIKNLKGTYKRRIKKAARTPLGSKASDDAMTRANDTLTNLSNRTAKNDTERRSTELYGRGGKIIKKAKGPKKPTPKKGDYVYSPYRNATISKKQDMNDREGGTNFQY